MAAPIDTTIRRLREHVRLVEGCRNLETCKLEELEEGGVMLGASLSSSCKENLIS